MRTILSAFRENSGKSFLDSGDAYGRHYDKPDIDPVGPIATMQIYKNEISGTICSARLLDTQFKQDDELAKQFEEWCETRPDLNWFAAAEQFMEDELGYSQRGRGNVYNKENDLDQMFIYEVYSTDMKGDWLYPDGEGTQITVFYAHTGCDVRGGYSGPVFCRPRANQDYTIPVDVVCGFSALEGRLDGEVLDSEALQKLDEHWQIGYSGFPSGCLDKDIERVFGFTFDKENNTVCALLKSGEVVKIVVVAPY